ncbi:MAG: hypothetical protein WCB11_08350, partial [Terriglobales bacterium]
VDHTHPAAAELLDDAIVRDRLADHVQNMLWRKSRQVNETRGVDFKFVTPYYRPTAAKYALECARHDNGSWFALLPNSEPRSI